MKEVHYYQALMKMGHMGAGNHLQVNIFIKSHNLISAITKAQKIPAIKHNEMPISIKEISYEEYLIGIEKGEYYSRMSAISNAKEKHEKSYNLYWWRV